MQPISWNWPSKLCLKNISCFPDNLLFNEQVQLWIQAGNMTAHLFNKMRSPEGLEFQAVSAWGLSLTANCCCTFQQHKTSSLLFNGFDGQRHFFSTISVLWWAMLLFILCHIDWWSSPFRIISLDEVYPFGSLSHTLEPFLMWNMPYVQERNTSPWIISYHFLPCFLWRCKTSAHWLSCRADFHGDN